MDDVHQQGEALPLKDRDAFRPFASAPAVHRPSGSSETAAIGVHPRVSAFIGVVPCAAPPYLAIAVSPVSTSCRYSFRSFAFASASSKVTTPDRASSASD